jgi:glycerophosphoryl diester phosphodiesterase
MAPENTLAAFRRAVELGARYIETDLQLSRDARLVALHDDTLQRTTDGRGPVASMTLEELKRLDAGSWFRADNGRGRFAGERIPTVEEVLAFSREYDVGVFLEIKAPTASGAEHAVVAAVHAASALLRSNVISFDLHVLERVRRIEPVLVLGYLFNKRTPDAVARALEAGARTLLPRSDRVTPELVEEARRNDLKIVTWTVNDPRQMKLLIDMGVDGIMTDYPDRLAALLRDSSRTP